MKLTSTDLQSGKASAADYMERVWELGPELDAAAEDIERRRELPEPIVEALIERGLFRLLPPRSLGGAELPPGGYIQVIEEVAKHDASTAWCLGQATGCTMNSAFLEPEDAAGATAIFESNPFERRLRYIHTVVQQYQGRQAHFKSVAQVLLGLQPESAMFTF